MDRIGFRGKFKIGLCLAHADYRFLGHWKDRRLQADGEGKY